MTATYGLSHIAVMVNSVEKTLKFYTHIFEMEVMYHKKKMIQLTTPGNKDILVFEEKNQHLAGQPGGITHFGFRLKYPEDISVLHNKILEAGGDIIDMGEFVPGSPYIFFKDPDGYTVEVWYEFVPPE